MLCCNSVAHLTLLAHRSYGHVHETSAASALNYLSPPLTVRLSRRLRLCCNAADAPLAATAIDVGVVGC
jgi:hypothetical protein